MTTPILREIPSGVNIDAHQISATRQPLHPRIYAALDILLTWALEHLKTQRASRHEIVVATLQAAGYRVTCERGRWIRQGGTW